LEFISAGKLISGKPFVNRGYRGIGKNTYDYEDEMGKIKYRLIEIHRNTTY
jgi:hypothetical protein